MKSLSLLLVLIGVVCVYSAETENPNADPEYREFKKAYGISYRGKAKEQQKYAQFKRNKAKIQEHNAKYEQGEESYTMDMNQFGDSTIDEIAEANFGLVPPPVEDIEKRSVGDLVRNKRATLLKESWDWRTQNGVSPVKNQKSCGSCWAFATIGVLESQYLIKKKQSVVLSEQNLVNCADEEYDSEGCNGGWPQSVMNYVIKNGVVTNSTCPYIAKDDTCKTTTGTFGKSGTIRSVRGMDINTVKNAIYSYGPCTAALYVGDDLTRYKNGTFPNKPDVSGKVSVNHAVIIVGYGKENGKEYFIVKNSWGPTWGEKGYFRVEITSEDKLMLGKYVVCYEISA